MPIDADFSAEQFVQKCPSHLSGADFYALTSRARQQALRRLISECQSADTTSSTVSDTCLTVDDFDQSLVDFQPTLSEQAFLEYEKYFEKYSGNSDKNKAD
jgi:SpoVK/Ycf46/Vps4 family AAA+-type ATPase